MSHENDFVPRASLKFAEIGDSHKGRLVAVTKRREYDINGSPKSLESGDPSYIYTWDLMQDDGSLATLWVKGNLYTVLKDAVAKSGAKSGDDIKGALVQVKHHALGEQKKGKHPAKLYQAKVTLMDAAERAKFAAAHSGVTNELPTDDPQPSGEGEYDPFPEVGE